jgi:hypothetical protein
MATPAPIREQLADPFKRHYTPKELAELWQLDESRDIITVLEGRK